MTTRLRAVFFDAVGTVLHPVPDVATVYAAVGRRFGSRLGVAAVQSRFRAAFARQEEVDRRAGWQASEAREVQRWRAVVREVHDDTTDPEACFHALYEHFGRPEHWRCEDLGPVVAALDDRAIMVGLASNFDRRLRRVVAGFPALA